MRISFVDVTEAGILCNCCPAPFWQELRSFCAAATSANQLPAARRVQYPTDVNSKADEMADRLRQFAIRVVRFARVLPGDGPAQAIAKQLAKSATSEAANYNAARRGRSRDEFVAKLAIAAEEADETENWFRIISEASIVSTSAGSESSID